MREPVLVPLDGVDRRLGMEAARAYLERSPARLRAEIRRHRRLAVGAAVCGLLALVDGLLLAVLVR